MEEIWTRNRPPMRFLLYKRLVHTAFAHPILKKTVFEDELQALDSEGSGLLMDPSTGICLRAVQHNHFGKMGGVCVHEDCR